MIDRLEIAALLSKVRDHLRIVTGPNRDTLDECECLALRVEVEECLDRLENDN